MSSVASRGAGFGGDEGNFGVAFGVIGQEGNVGIALDDEELVVVGAATGVFGDPIAGTNLTVELVGDVLFSAVGGCALGIAFTGEAVEEEEFAVVVDGMSVGDVPVVTKVGEPVCVPEEATGIVTSPVISKCCLRLWHTAECLKPCPQTPFIAQAEHPGVMPKAWRNVLLSDVMFPNRE